MKYILTIDLGTTGNRVIVFDKNANIILKKYKELTQIYPKPGWVEHDPKEILESVKQLLDDTLKHIPPDNITAIGITNQRETVVCWDKNTGIPLYNAIVWQDCRTQDLCAELNKEKELAEYITKNTGLKIDPYFSATKIRWLIENIVKDKKEILFGTIDSWIIWNLTKEHVTDHTNASRTMLYNINTNQWDPKLLGTFNVKEEMLPKIVNSSEIVGSYNNIPIAGIAGDQQAALFGHRCFEEGEIKNTYGTGCFCLMNTGKNRLFIPGMLTTVAVAINNQVNYALEGSVFIGGAVIQWLRDELKLISNAEETEKICNSVNDTNGVYLIPAFAGLGTPHWNTKVRGAIFGLTRGANTDHIVRAAVESIALQSKDLIDTLKSEHKTLNADGGATNNNFLMQFQADILNKTVIVPDIEETTALGAAFLAGLATDYWSKQDIKELKINHKEYKPSMPEETRQGIISTWDKYISQLVK